MANKSESVKVVIRCRPLSQTEKDQGEVAVVEMDTAIGKVTVNDGKEAKDFQFDACYDEKTPQRLIYDDTAYPIVTSAMEGFNGTIFCYGQTGTGKTWTMAGNPKESNLKGIIPNTFDHVFLKIGAETRPGLSFLVSVSYLEIYQEEVRDLLGEDTKKKLQMKESKDVGVYVGELSKHQVGSVEEMDSLLQRGTDNRVVGATKMNPGSSRSHSIFSIEVEIAEQIDGDEKPRVRKGKLHLVDLAGSERQKSTEAEGLRLKEGAKINLSLSALGNVISALVEPKATHVPYRDSKLTRLLQDSLGGNAKTVMIANIGPAKKNAEETIGTLRWAGRAKLIKNKPKINEDPKDALIRQFQEEIDKLKQQLGIRGGVVDPGVQIEQIVQGVDPELLNQIKSEKEEQVMKILQEKGIVEAEAKRIADQLRVFQEKEAKEKETKAVLTAKLQSLQSHIVIGGENLLDKTQQQEQRLKLQAQELEQKQLEAKRLERELSQKQEEFTEQEEKVIDLRESVDIRTKKLKKLWVKLKESQSEIKDIQEGFQKERTEMLDMIRDLTKQYKLKILVINNYIPQNQLNRIEKRATWDDDSGEWNIRNIHLAGNNFRGNHKPNNFDFDQENEEEPTQKVAIRENETTSPERRQTRELSSARVNSTSTPMYMRRSNDRPETARPGRKNVV